MFDGADIVNGILYAAEGDYVNAAISFACGIPAVGTVIAGVAKMSKAAKAMKAADRIADLCKAAGKVGNTAAGMKANYDTYMQARREGKSVGEAMTYMAGAMMAGLAMGKAASWGANKLKNLANKALPKLKTAVQEGAGKLASKISKGLGTSGSGHMKRNRGYVVNPFYKSGSKTEVFYRTMSQLDYDYLRMTGELPSTGETFISPTYEYSSNYNGITVEFELKKGTTKSWLEIGVGNNSDQAIKDYGILPQVAKGWTQNNAFFKGEGSQTNIGLGQGKALEIFNSNIVNFKKVGGGK